MPPLRAYSCFKRSGCFPEVSPEDGKDWRAPSDQAKEWRDVTETVESGLLDAGCASAFIEQYRVAEAAGDTQACLDLLRRHRCELVCALHEAQRPIDVCDWIIRGLERKL